MEAVQATSRASTRGSSRSSWMTRAGLVFAGLFCFAFLVVPLAGMLLDTLRGDDGFSLAAWGDILTNDVERLQLWNSIQLGFASVAIAFVFGAGHAWLTERTDLPGAQLLGPLGVAPLVVPPILVAMGFADFLRVDGFWACAGLLGASYAPFVAVLTARGLRSIDGRAYEAAWLARGRFAAERLLFRASLPEITAGCLFAFVFVLSERGVPDFLTVKGKTWLTYAEFVFSRWNLRAMGNAPKDLASPIVAAVPLVAIILIALALALRFRAHSALRGETQPLPVRRLGAWRWPALLLPLVYLTAGVGVPIFVMGRWAMGSTQLNEPMSVEILRTNFQGAIEQSGDDMVRTLTLGVLSALVVLAVAIPLARAAARGVRGIETFSIVPLAVPAILLGIGYVKVFNPLSGPVHDATGFDFYDSTAMVVCAFATRFLPFGVLTLAHQARRLPKSLDEAALLSGRSPLARAWRIHLPLFVPAGWSAACLIFILGIRELDLAVVLPAGNDTVVRRLANIVHFGGEDTGGALALMLLAIAAVIPVLTLILTGRKLRSLS